jgi:hypothetical protein
MSMSAWTNALREFHEAKENEGWGEDSPPPTDRTSEGGGKKPKGKGKKR